MGRLVPIGRLAALAAMLGIAAALTVGAAGAKPAKAHHARCVSGASRAKGKSAKRRAKCKKPRKTAHGHNRVAQKVGRPSSVIKPSAGGTPPASSPTTTGPAPATSGTAPTAPLRTAPTAPSGTAPAAPSGTAPGTTRPPPTAPTPTKPARTPAEEQELTEAEAAHKAAAEAVARELPGELPLPEGAVQVNTEPGLEGPAFRPATPQLVDAERYWQVPGEPRAVITWIEAHVPAGAKLSTKGDSSGPRGMTWFASFSFTTEQPYVISSEDLVFEATAVEGGGAALRADGQVVWALPRAASEHIPAGVSAISVRATASEPSPISVSQTITDAASVQRVIALIEGLRPPGEGFRLCPIDLPGSLMLELGFLGATQEEPVAKVVVKTGGCGSIALWVHGQFEGYLEGARSVAEAIETLLGTKLLSREGELAP